VVLEPEERRAHSLMQQLRTVKNDKVRKRKQKQAARMESKQRLLAKEQDKRDDKARQARKRVYKQQGIEELRAKRQRTGGSYED
jgi:ribosome biogenesis protein BMS1